MSPRASSSSVPGRVIPDHVLERANVTTLSRAVLKRDRSLAVPERFAEVLRAAGLAPGLPRGSVCAVTGPASVALTAVLLTEASKLGSWVAWCSTDAPNPRALFDAGWCLDRLVCIDPQRQWAACMGACIGEFEIVVTQLPVGVPAGEARRVSVAASRSNGIVVVLAAQRSSSMPADIEFRVVQSEWNLEVGHLRSQAMHVVLDGRRVAESRRFDVVFSAS